MQRRAEQVYEEFLVLKAQDGEADGLSGLFELLNGALIRHAGRVTRNADAAGDVVQEAWIAISRNIRRLDDPARFRPWAYRIVTNKAHDWGRRQAKLQRLNEQAAEDAETAAQTTSEADDDIRLIRRALTALDADRRAVLTLFYIEGMRVAEIAEALAIPQGTVKSRLYHAREYLRKAIERSEQ
ncbi:MAG: RNA polymerase sigma factor [Sphingomonadales bacterium]|nr:RNA polymerase sigma factor [Sphingomonadales bacterium]